MEPSVPGNGLSVFLLNQSRSMGSAFGDYGVTMAEAATDAINLYLQKVVQFRLAVPEEFSVDEFGVVVLGYGSDGDAERPILRMDAERTVPDPKRTRYDESTISSSKNLPHFPFWLVPLAAGEAPLRRALSSAAEIIEAWISEHGSAAPPLVMNVTDGSVADGDPTGDAEKIMRLSTSMGHATVWNCHLASSGSAPVLFPRDDDAGSLEDGLRVLLRSSSLVPQVKIRDLSMEFPEVSRPVGARTCVLDADFTTLIRLISCATRLPLP